MALKLNLNSTAQTVPITVSGKPGQHEAIRQNLQVIADKLTAEEISTLRKVAEKPPVKALALNAAKKFV